ncbi:amino acid transporter [Cryptosporidium sp. chipmunk genotype I]|uniref:amino acid transporter n=1 Tax=Cryptosporidium sp. chipmunk genotype I TaxID=1280935 RepID=UPI00351A473A|nr:amino acid transporter [Cryptosporidium sp. chipmunk genotype I]
MSDTCSRQITVKDENQVEEISKDKNKQKIEKKLGKFSKSELTHMGIGFITVFKAAIGTGILFSPKGVVNTGYILSALIMFYYWVLNVLSTLLLMQSADRVNGNYSSIAMHAMGKFGKFLLEFSLISTAISFGSIYVTFITNNIQDIIAGVHNCSPEYLNYGSALITFLQLIVYIPLVSARKIQSLAPVILISNFALISAIALVLVQSFRTLIRSHIKSSFYNIPAISDTSNIPGFVGTAAYLWVCAPVTLSYYSSINNQREKRFFTWIYLLAIFVVFVFALTFTFLCAFAYGESTLSAITLNLPFTPLAMGGKILYSVSVLLSLPLMVYPMKEIFSKYSSGLSQRIFPKSEIEITEGNPNKHFLIKSNSTISMEGISLNEQVIVSCEEPVTDYSVKDHSFSPDLNYTHNFNFKETKHFKHKKLKTDIFEVQNENVLPSFWMMISCIFITFLGYILHDSLSNLINLIGGLFCVPLNILLPALFHFIIFRKEIGIKFIIIDFLLIISGIFTSILVIWYSILNWSNENPTICTMKDSEGFK